MGIKKLAKKTLFYSVLIVLVIVAAEASARAFYFIKRGNFNHLLPANEINTIRKVIPFKGDRNKASIEEKGDFLIKNGYYSYNPKISAIDLTDTAGDVLVKNGVRINNIGFRGDDVEPKEGAIRVWCLGGSTTFGYYVKHPYPEIVNEFLNEGGKEYEVINTGISAANGQHIYNMLCDTELERTIEPDILVINTVWNTTEQCENSFLAETIENKILRNAVKNSVMAFFIYKGILFLKYGEFLGPFQLLCAYADKICSWASERGIRVILVNEPQRLDERAWKATAQYPVSHARASRALRQFENRYKGTAFFAAVPFFEEMDFNDKAEVDKYFIDRGHLNEEGYVIEAEEIARIIRNIPVEQKKPEVRS